MNSVEKQRHLIEQLYNLICSSAEEGYETAVCKFTYEKFEDGSRSIGAIFSYKKNGLNKSEVLAFPERLVLNEVIPELHSEMKQNTGGDWKSFTLTVNEDGSVSTNFDY